jgi:hypothetical protein
MRRRAAEGGWAFMAGSKLLTSWEAEALLLKVRTWPLMVSCVMMRWPVKVRRKFMSFPAMRSIEPRRWRRHIVWVVRWMVRTIHIGSMAKVGFGYPFWRWSRKVSRRFSWGLSMVRWFAVVRRRRWRRRRISADW